MAKHKLLSWILAFGLLCNTTVMKAQSTSPVNDSLTAQQQSLVTISALTAAGNMEQLQVQLAAGLHAGLTINEIKEALVQLYAYCGFPKSLNAINTFMAVLDERKVSGITDPEGRKIIVGNDTSNKYEQGRKVLETLTKIPQPKPAPGYGEFAPRVDVFLKEHLFADIFSSDVLGYLQRELVTISALAAMPGTETQLRSHIDIGRNLGVTSNQFAQLVLLIEKAVNRTQANIVRKQTGQQLLSVIEPGLMVRISEIEIFPEHLNAYKLILKEEAAASVEKEPGVIAIFPMYQQENPAQVRIVEMYANEAAYKAHLQTPHFQHYKTSTLKMVKALKLVDMQALDAETMPAIFRKLQ